MRTSSLVAKTMGRKWGAWVDPNGATKSGDRGSVPIQCTRKVFTKLLEPKGEKGGGRGRGKKGCPGRQPDKKGRGGEGNLT